MPSVSAHVFHILRNERYSSMAMARGKETGFFTVMAQGILVTLL
jgi:hypothetical protein